RVEMPSCVVGAFGLTVCPGASDQGVVVSHPEGRVVEPLLSGAVLADLATTRLLATALVDRSSDGRPRSVPGMGPEASRPSAWRRPRISSARLWPSMYCIA